MTRSEEKLQTMKCKSDWRDEFDYVVKKVKPARICFGSGEERFAVSARCSREPENIPTISPDKYDKGFTGALYNILNKPRSLKGAVARFAERMKPIRDPNPAPCTYSLPSIFKERPQSKYPFNSSSMRITVEVTDLPGPGYYYFQDTKKLKIPFYHSFGGQKCLAPAVDIKCDPIQIDICKRCGNVPFGDYWHKSNKAFLCRKCMLKERRLFSKLELAKWRKIRDCSFMHYHDGSNAALILMSNEELHKLRTREAYLELFFP